MTENFEKNRKKIREMMAVLRDEKYAIVNPALTELDEFMKNLYLKVLCTVVQYENEPSEMQILFLKRIVKGMGVEEPAEDYLRKALEISDEDMREFFTLMKGNKIKYYFAMDGLLLTFMGDVQETAYEYLAEIIELMGICKDDLEYVCKVAGSVLQQQSSLYDEAKELLNERVAGVNYAPYIRNFYVGAISDSRECVHFFAPDRKYSQDIPVWTYYTEKSVVLENLNINIEGEWMFDSCENVVFENCYFSGNIYSIELYRCQSVYIHKCCFENFKSPVLCQAANGMVLIDGCKFENCIYEYTRGYNDWGALGGVIHNDEGKNSNIIRETRFTKCGGKNDKYYHSSAIISNCVCEVYSCRFYNCWSYNSGFMDYGPKQTLFLPDTKGSENEIVNSAAFC